MTIDLEIKLIVQELYNQHKSFEEIASALHISERKFRETINQSLELQEIIAAGDTSFKAYLISLGKAMIDPTLKSEVRFKGDSKVWGMFMKQYAKWDTGQEEEKDRRTLSPKEEEKIIQEEIKKLHAVK